jgi:preprotein translocase subunit SecF
MEIIPHDININIVGHRKKFVAASLAAVLLSMFAIAVKGLNYGIDFAGGTELQVKIHKAADISEVRNVVNGMGFRENVVQSYGKAELNEFLIRVGETSLITEGQIKSIEQRFLEKIGKESLRVIKFDRESDKIELMLNKPVKKDLIEEIVSESGLKGADIKHQSRQQEYLIVPMGVAKFIEQGLKTHFGKESVELRKIDFVGPKVGRELRTDGVLALIYAIIGILFYIAVRFDLYFAPGAVVALIHDVLITVGVFSLLEREFSLATIAALLAIIGYSLNDTIVIYDRIRDNLAKFRSRMIEDVVNSSLNQTLSRTILTSLTTLIVVTSLFIYGSGVIKDFSLAIIIGVFVGSYSSLYIASPVYILLQKKFGKATS